MRHHTITQPAPVTKQVQIAANTAMLHMQRAMDELQRRGRMPPGPSLRGPLRSDLGAVKAHLDDSRLALQRVQSAITSDIDTEDLDIAQMQLLGRKSLEALRAAWVVLSLHGVLPEPNGAVAPKPGVVHVATLRRAFVRAQSCLLKLTVALGKMAQPQPA
jgi:hypothetical protein